MKKTMQKLLVITLIMTIGISLISCGSSGEASLDHNMSSAPDAPDRAAETPTASWSTPDSDQLQASADSVAETPVPESTLDEVTEDVLNYIKAEGMIIPDESFIKDLIELEYCAGEVDAFNIFSTLCAEGYIVSAPVAPEGIIVLSYSNNSPYPYYNWSSTGTYKFTPFTISLDCIDPDTGAVRHLRTFSSEETHSCSLATNGLGSNTTLSLMHFNSDLTHLTATLTLQDGSVHVGWIDENGEFTDVSAKITADAGDFGALTKHSNPCFGPGGYFYFRDSTNSNVQDKRVPLHNLTVSAVETLNDDVHYKGLPVYPYPDGTLKDGDIMKFYYDESMTYPVTAGYFKDWISLSECVGIDDNIIYKYTLSGNEQRSALDFDYWYNEKIALIPDIKGRENRNPVVSPDGTRVAFLSALTTGADNAPYLYIVSADGGNPVKVSTDYAFSDTNVYTSWVDGFYSTFLLTWE